MLLNPPNRMSGAINRNGLRNARRAPVPDPFAAYYGTGVEQIPLHLLPEDSVLDGDGNVVSIANRGGAGAAFNATASTTGITRTGVRLVVPTTGVYLGLANPADLVGTRLFMVTALDASATGLINFAGRFGAEAAGERSNIRWDIANNRFMIQRRNASAAWDNLSLNGSVLGTTLHLIEIELAASNGRLWIDGALQSSMTNTWPDLRVDRIFGGTLAPFFTGTAGDILSVVTDGTAGRDSTMLTVRQAIAAKHGIALP